MEDMVNRNVFEVIIASISGAVGFLYAWVTRNTLRANKMSELLASFREISKGQSIQIDDIKKDIKSVKGDVGQMKVELSVVLIRVNKVLDQLGE